jgi:hypothetical protein
MIRSRWGPGPESAGATGDAGQARRGRARTGGGPDRAWRGVDGYRPEQRPQNETRGGGGGFVDFRPKNSIHQRVRESKGSGRLWTVPDDGKCVARLRRGVGAVSASALPPPSRRRLCGGKTRAPNWSLSWSAGPARRQKLGVEDERATVVGQPERTDERQVVLAAEVDLGARSTPSSTEARPRRAAAKRSGVGADVALS